MFLEFSGHSTYMGFWKRASLALLDPLGELHKYSVRDKPMYTSTRYRRKRRQLLQANLPYRGGRGRNVRWKRYRSVLGPRRMQVRLRFANQFVLDAGAAGAAATFVMSANGIFDPEEAAGIHQPRGFDQYMAMWRTYGVIKAKITCHFAQDANTNDASICGIIVQDDNTISTAVQTNMESYNLVTGSLGRVGDGPPLTLSKSVDILSFLGRRGNISDDDDLQGSVSTNPVDGVFFVVWAAPIDPAIDNGPVNCVCYIDYWVDFFQHTRPPVSDQ